MRMNLRYLSVIGLIICAAALCVAYFVEYNFSVTPCPLCELQRGVFGALGVIFLFGSLVRLSIPVGWLYILLAEIMALSGWLLAARQVWLQYYAPPQKLTCSASLARLIDAYPFLEALKFAITGSSDCASIEFTILGTSIAGWSFIIFGLFCILMPYLYFRQTKR